MAVEAEAIAVTITGAAESGEADKLSWLIGEVHARAERTSCPVIVDVRALEFAASACLRVLASWVMRVAEAARPYKIVIVSSSAYTWQRRTLRALAGASKGVVQVRAGA